MVRRPAWLDRVPVILVVAILALACGDSTGAGAAVHSTPVPTGPCHYVGDDPDPGCTPGWSSAAVTQATVATTICRPGYSDSVRPSGSYTQRVKRQLLGAYGGTAPADAYELDHLVPLEDGGNPTDPRNLWPMPWEWSSSHPRGIAAPGHGAQTKDRLEDELHRRICLPRTDPAWVGLDEARGGIAADWRGYAVRLGLAS